MHESIWRGVNDSERCARYYYRLADKMRRRHSLSLVVSAVASAGAVGTSLAPVTEWVPAVLLGVVLAALADLYQGEHSKKAGVAAVVGLHCEQLVVEWRRLWFEQSVPGTPVLERITGLDRRLSEVTSLYDGAHDEKLNRRCTEEAHAATQAEFAR